MSRSETLTKLCRFCIFLSCVPKTNKQKTPLPNIYCGYKITYIIFIYNILVMYICIVIMYVTASNLEAR